MRIGRGVLFGVVAAGWLAAGSVAVAEPKVTVSPAAGVYAATQVVDIVVIVEGLGDLGVEGGQILFDDHDVTGAVVGCLRPEPLADALSFRCPGIPMGALELGTHIFSRSSGCGGRSGTGSGRWWCSRAGGAAWAGRLAGSGRT